MRLSNITFLVVTRFLRIVSHAAEWYACTSQVFNKAWARDKTRDYHEEIQLRFLRPKCFKPGTSALQERPTTARPALNQAFF